MFGPARALLLVFLSGALTAACGSAAQMANQKECTDDQAMHALDEADVLRTWDAVYRSFKTFGHCDDGAIAEGYDDSIIRLLVSDWNHFDDLARLSAGDQAFEKFVLRHIDELASEEQLSTIAKNANSRCPPGQIPLCRRISAAISSLLSDSSVFLGVLEDVPGHYANQPNVRAVRVLFKKNGSEWQPFRSNCPDQGCLKEIAKQYPLEISWNIAFDGKKLGQITTLAPLEFKFYGDVGLEEITSSGPIPIVGKRSQSYAGFAASDVYRPLVAVSQPNYTDPEVWKPARLAGEMIAALRQEFRKKFPKVSNCTNPEENIEKPWLYHDEDIVIGKIYASQKKWHVAQMRLEKWSCDGPTHDGGPFDSQWYVVDPGGTIRFLDSGMWLVDAGDYDNDGKSELVFAIDRYNLGGYELFYDEFTKHAVFEFAYH
jgi:hypothetical protein